MAFFVLGLHRYISIDTLRQHRDALHAWVDTHPVLAPLAFMGIYIVFVALSLPGAEVLSITGGLLFGVVWGTVYIVISATLGATILFLMAKTTLSDYLYAKAGPWLRRMQAGFQDNALSYLLVLRLIPLFPFFIVNLVPAFLGVSWQTYVVGTFIGIIPVTFVYASVGAGLDSFLAAGGDFGAQDILTPHILTALIGLAVLAIVPVLYKKVKDLVADQPGQVQATMRGPSIGGTSMSVNTPSNTEIFTMDMAPEDEHNARLRVNTHPLDWHNPTPRNPYNLVVIGAGTAGLVTAAGAAAMGARVALIEKHLMGGDCLNYGCVPSKGLIRCATAWADVRNAGIYGIVIPGKVSIDFGAVLERMRRLRAVLSEHDSVGRFAAMSVDVFLGEGRFTGPGTVEVGGASLTFAKAVIATGSRPAVPSVPGLEDAGCMTNETVFNVTERPARLGVIGGGPIGCELAQTFQRLGSQVVLFHRGAHVLNKEDADAAEIVQQALRRDGVQLLLDTTLLAVEPRGAAKVLRYRNGAGETSDVTVDAILVATGRLPNVEELGLEAVGVAFDPHTGIQVDDRLRTSNPRIFAAGDVCSRYQFTHAADFLARTVLANALFMGRQKASALTIPWCTYTDPQIAHVGITEQQAAAQGISLDTFTLPLTKVDRAVLDGETEGFAKVHAKKGSDTILGATVVARNAGDMIGIYTTAMTHGLGLAALAKVIQPYPTQAEAIRKTADLYNRTRLTTRVKQLMAAWLWWQRRWAGARAP